MCPSPHPPAPSPVDSGHGLGWGGHSAHRLPLSRAEDKMSSEICLIQRKSSSKRRAIEEALGKERPSSESLKEACDLAKKIIEEYLGDIKLQEQRHKGRNM